MFNKKIEESEEEDENGGGDTDRGGNSEFGEKWAWISLIDLVSETTRCRWDDVWEMNVYEFFNYVAYAKDKAAEKERQIKEWQKKH